jgi:uncharacterized membrane protein YoaK (UPF0700 family)
VFQREGPARDARTNLILAAYLAATAGYVNSGGFVLIGSFTSHVTGSIGRFANDLANGSFGASISALSLALAFFGGAVAASFVLDGSSAKVPLRYCFALAIEAGLLLCFVFIAGLSRTTHPRLLDAMAALLCAAMGLQNSLVTRLSGAIVRTTHLTGIVTDLAAETVRWYRWYHWRLLTGPRPSQPPRQPPDGRIALLLTITIAFVVGAAAGAVLTARASRWAMCLPAALVGAASAFAFYQSLAPGGHHSPGPLRER